MLVFDFCKQYKAAKRYIPASSNFLAKATIAFHHQNIPPHIAINIISNNPKKTFINPEMFPYPPLLEPWSLKVK